MQFSILSALGFLAASAVAAPGGCSEYSYDIAICESCSYRSGNYYPRELDERGNKCYKECPKEERKCKDHGSSSESSTSLQVEYSQQDISCPRDYSYDLQVKLEACSRDANSQECLNVYYRDSGSGHRSRSTISRSNLGIYLEQQEYYNPDQFNYNNYCHGDYCSVPTHNLPSYPDLCGKEIYLAVGNDRCYNDYNFNDSQYRESTRYVKVQVECSKKEHHNKPCKEECCCPRRD